jgi:hypothetical protein
MRVVLGAVGTQNIIGNLIPSNSTQMGVAILSNRLSYYRFSDDGKTFNFITAVDSIHAEQSIGSAHMLSLSPDNNTIVCAEMGSRMIINKIDNSVKPVIISVPEICAVAAAKNHIYTASGSTIHGTMINVYDYNGNLITGSTTLRGFDLIVDDARQTIWTCGKD